MITFADLTTNKHCSIKEFRKIENSNNKEFLNRLNKTGIKIDCYKIDIRLSKENEKFYTVFLTLPILEKLQSLNFPIKNILKYNGKTIESIEELHHKETVYLNSVKKFRNKVQDLPMLNNDFLFILQNNSLKQASLLK